MLLGVISLLAVVGCACTLPHHPLGSRDMKIMEGELTEALQKALAPYDPFTISFINNLPIITDDASIVYGAVDTLVTQFSKVLVTSFLPPVPWVSDYMTVDLRVPLVVSTTDNYSLSGTFNGAPITSSGQGTVSFTRSEVSLHFKTEYYSMSPVTLCVQPGSLNVQFDAEAITWVLEGADEDLSEEINSAAPKLILMIEQIFNANANKIVSFINDSLCS